MDTRTRRAGHAVDVYICARPPAGAAAEAQAEALLAKAGGRLRDLVRTWMWLGDILSLEIECAAIRSS